MPKENKQKDHKNKEEKQEIVPKSAISLREEATLAFWQKNDIFKKTLEQPSPKGNFVFYDGPPFATGQPHYGHIPSGTMKDAIPRYKTMRGYHVPRRWGWDTHGLPIENLIEKELGLKNKKDIEDFGIEKFNDAARAAVLRYDADWKKIVPRTGRWVDMDNAYLTMNSTYTESIWWSFKTLHEKGLIYQGFKVMHLCPHDETTLANFEVNQGYKDITDLSVYAKFELADEPGTFVLAWTTTPWTLPGNVALAIHPAIDYVKVESTLDGKTEKYILAKDRLQALKEHPYKILEENVKLVGKKYKPVFPYYKDAELKNKENIWKIVGADFVTVTDGTGIVHIAPAFGEDDYNLSLKENLPFIQHVAMNGLFKKEVTDFAGQPVKPKDDHQKADIEIIKYLARNGTLFAKEKFIHSYPHCWRCDTPLLNYATSSWFVRVTDMKEKLVALNKGVHWVPAEIGEGRFGKWLEGARDWAISRSRFWGAPLPVWKCAECEKIEVIGSVAELKKRAGKVSENRKGELDLHRPFIDAVTFTCTCGGAMKRVPEVFDTWYESGSMPYGQMHYPFENKNLIDQGMFFPADFIAEGQDQTRGWFYTLLILSAGLFDKAPYKNVIVNGIVLAEDGQKMSKRLKNYPDMNYVLDKFGADALRYYMLASPVVKAEDISFSEKGLDEVVKKLIMRLSNVASFYELYKGSDAGEFAGSKNALDRWMLSRLAELYGEVTTHMEGYEIDRAARPFDAFIDDLSTWYIRRSRDRFKGDDEADKAYALATLKHVLIELSKLLAPFMPFLAEDIYQRAKGSSGKESVHLEAWPEHFLVDANIVLSMKEAREVVSLALEARAAAGIKVRQPLRELFIKNAELAQNLELIELVKDEVNVKKVSSDIALLDRVKLDVEITPELKQEGLVRDLIREIQEMRKGAKLNPSDVVELVVHAKNPDIQAFVKENEAELMKQTKVKKITLSGEEGEGTAVNIGDFAFALSIIKE